MANRSYAVFSQSSGGTGQRNTWDGGVADGTSSPDSVPGIVQGVPTAVAASNFDANANVEQVNGVSARHSLDFIAGGTFAGSGLAANLAGGRVFSGAAGNQNPLVAGGFADGVLGVSLANADWNGIKNVELLVDSEDVPGLSGISIRNVVDVRIKLGDVAIAPSCDGDGHAGRHVVDIENVKRGELIASASDKGIAAAISLATNLVSPNVSEWQASFVVVGSQFGDSLLIARGDMAGPARTLPGQVFDTSGKLQLVVANLGGGDDVFDGNGAEAQTAVTLASDFGTLFLGSGGTVTLGVSGGEQGAKAQLADWFADAAAAGIDLSLGAYFKTAGGAIATAAAASVLAGEADVAAIAGTDFNAGFAQASGMWSGPADLGVVQNTPALFPDAGGIGISQPTRTEFFGGGASLANPDNAAANGMGELNAWGGADGNAFTDVLVVSWGGAETIAAKVALNYFYCGENGGEVARIQLWNDGALVDDALYGPIELLVPTGTFSATNGGEGSIVIAKGIAFDEIRFLGHNTAASMAVGDPSDYLVDGIDLVLAGTGVAALGGDRAFAGAGADNFLYSVANGDGVDTIHDFAAGGGPAPGAARRRQLHGAGDRRRHGRELRQLRGRHHRQGCHRPRHRHGHRLRLTARRLSAASFRELAAAAYCRGAASAAAAARAQAVKAPRSRQGSASGAETRTKVPPAAAIPPSIMRLSERPKSSMSSPSGSFSTRST